MKRYPYYSTLEGNNSKPFGPLFKPGTAIDQFGRDQSTGPGIADGKSVWEHRIIGLSSTAPGPLKGCPRIRGIGFQPVRIIPALIAYADRQDAYPTFRTASEHARRRLHRRQVGHVHDLPRQPPHPSHRRQHAPLVDQQQRHPRQQVHRDRAIQRPESPNGQRRGCREVSRAADGSVPT